MFEPKISSPAYEEARTKIYPLLGWEANEERRSCLVAIDGDLGAGKTHFANWLAWQFGAPVVYIDLYRDQVQFKTEEIERIIRLRLSQNRMVIFEGLYAFKILSKLNLNPKIKFKVVRNDKANEDARHEMESYVENYPSLFEDVHLITGFE